MAERTKGRKILETLEDGHLTRTSGEGDPPRKDMPKRKRPGQKRGKIASPRKQEHKYVVPWAIVE